MANNGGFFSGIQVMNTGTAATDITIAYSANSATGSSIGTPTADICPGVLPGQSCTRLQLNGQWTDKYVGTTITNSAGQNLVAISKPAKFLPAKVAAYEGFNPAAAQTSAVAPLIMANNGGFFTGIQIQNVGSGPCDVTVAYGPNCSTCPVLSPASDLAPGLAAGTSITFLQLNGNGVTKWSGINMLARLPSPGPGQPARWPLLSMN